MTGASEVFDLAADMKKAATEVMPALRSVVQEGMSDIKDTWQSNAREQIRDGSAAAYPDSITYETRVLAGSIVGVVGPDLSKKQGFLARVLELGAERNPPQLNGLRAVDALAPQLERRFSVAITYLLP